MITPIALYLTITLNLPGIGERTTQMYAPDRYQTIEECSDAAKRLENLDTPDRKVRGACVINPEEAKNAL